MWVFDFGSIEGRGGATARCRPGSSLWSQAQHRWSDALVVPLGSFSSLMVPVSAENNNSSQTAHLLADPPQFHHQGRHMALGFLQTCQGTHINYIGIFFHIFINVHVYIQKQKSGLFSLVVACWSKLPTLILLKKDKMCLFIIFPFGQNSFSCWVHLWFPRWTPDKQQLYLRCVEKKIRLQSRYHHTVKKYI